MLGVKIEKIEILDDDASKHGESGLESFLLAFFQIEGVGIGHWGWEKQKSVSLMTTDLWDSGFMTHQNTDSSSVSGDNK